MPICVPGGEKCPRYGRKIRTFGALPALAATVCPSVVLAMEVNAAYDGLCEPDAFSRPLCHGLLELSRNVNQTNIWMFGSAFAIDNACFAYFACTAVVTPCGSPGFVSWPYSVIQIGTARWNHLFRSFSNWGSVDSVTF